MTKTKILGGVLLACFAMFILIGSSDRAESNNQGDKKTMLRHVVIFKFKESRCRKSSMDSEV